MKIEGTITENDFMQAAWVAMGLSRKDVVIAAVCCGPLLVVNAFWAGVSPWHYLVLRSFSWLPSGVSGGGSGRCIGADRSFRACSGFSSPRPASFTSVPIAEAR